MTRDYSLFMKINSSGLRRGREQFVLEADFDAIIYYLRMNVNREAICGNVVAFFFSFPFALNFAVIP
jgi:hypothetical protein